MKGLSLLLATAATANAQALVKKSLAVEAPAPLPTLFKRQQFQEPCEEVSASWAAQKAEATGTTSSEPVRIRVPAEVAYDCLQSVPVDVEGDVKQIQELKDLLQWQTTTSWLKKGVEGHNEPLDLFSELDAMSQKLKAGGYKSDYEFQIGLYSLFMSAQDFHLRWNSDILEPLPFVRDGAVLTQLSKDGLSLPEVYLASDVGTLAKLNYTPSAIKTINGVDVVQFLTNTSSQAFYHDADARYNANFINKAKASMGQTTLNVFTEGLYPGPTTDFVFANGTKKSLPNVAIIQAQFDFTNVTDGQSFFNTFCQGPPQATTQPTPTPSATFSNETSTPSATPSALPTPTDYPSPVFVNSDLAFQGYYLNGSGYDKVAVLAMPDYGPKAEISTNDPEGTLSGANEAQKLLRTFLGHAADQGKTKLVVDLRGNTGGTIDMGFEVFKQLFPTVEPYGASRYRAHEAFQIYSAGLAAIATNLSIEQAMPEVWEATAHSDFFWQNILDVNDTQYDSFQEYYGPYTFNDDTFINIRRYNFSNHQGGHTTSGGFNLTGYAPQPTPPQYFKPDDIVLVMDGTCGSTCAIFAELMREQGGVNTIMIGGRPSNGPAQGVGGSKGSQVLPFDAIYSAMVQTEQALESMYISDVGTAVNSTAVGRIAAGTQLLIRSAHYAGETRAGAVNSLNNFRENDTTQTPLEFIYEAADCRLFDTIESFLSPVPLWQRVVDAKWGNGQCVSGSTGDKTSISVVDNKPFNKNTNSSSSPPEYTGTASGLQISGAMISITAVIATLLMI